MTFAFHKGGFRVRLARDAADLALCQRFRHARFFGGEGRDSDAHDARCTHVMVEGPAGLVATFRTFLIDGEDALSLSYAAGRYNFAPLAGLPIPMLELGRVCLAQDVQGGDVLRLAWGALARIVDARGAGLIFGCTSFAGTDPDAYRDTFGWLAARHRGPTALIPAPRDPGAVPLKGAFDTRRALRSLPPLLRGYLNLGGWVGDRAVVDEEMGTLHVFTALDVTRIPPARAAALRALSTD